MAIFTYPLFFFSFSICFIISSASNSLHPKKVSSQQKSLVLNLIHPKNIYSQEKSVAHLQHLQSKASGDVIAHLSRGDPPSFLVNISIGSPPLIQLLHLDTATSFTWLQCSPCNCYLQKLPFFVPSDSSTYRNEWGTCGSSESQWPKLQFDSVTDSCRYYMHYMDGSYSHGVLAKETITFNTIYGDYSSASLANVEFGCGRDNIGGSQLGSGVMGLGYDRLSLVHRLGSKFSYCFGSLEDTSNPNNVLIIGDDSKIMGDTTSLEIDDSMYFVSMEGITVGGIPLAIDPVVFQRDYQKSLGGTILDTGTSYTRLVKEAHEQLQGSIEDLFEGRFNTSKLYSNLACYYGDLEKDLIDNGFPNVVFHFADGAELSLEVKSLFSQRKPDIFCLTVIRNPTETVIGTATQQNYNVGYNLEEMKVSFEKIDCALLFDD